MSTPAAQPCPFCAELIPEDTDRCGYCGESVREAASSYRYSDRGPEVPEGVEFIVPVNVSGWALASCYCGFIGMCVPFAGLLFAVPAVVFGIIALKRRSRATSYGGVTGNIRAVLGLVFGGIGTVVWGVASVWVLLMNLGILK